MEVETPLLARYAMNMAAANLAVNGKLPVALTMAEADNGDLIVVPVTGVRGVDIKDADVIKTWLLTALASARVLAGPSVSVAIVNSGVAKPATDDEPVHGMDQLIVDDPSANPCVIVCCATHDRPTTSYTLVIGRGDQGQAYPLTDWMASEADPWEAGIVESVLNTDYEHIPGFVANVKAAALALGFNEAIKVEVGE